MYQYYYFYDDNYYYCSYCLSFYIFNSKRRGKEEIGDYQNYRLLVEDNNSDGIGGFQLKNQKNKRRNRYRD